MDPKYFIHALVVTGLVSMAIGLGIATYRQRQVIEAAWREVGQCPASGCVKQ